MLTLRLQGVYLHRSFVAWTTEERTPKRLSLSTSAHFEKCSVPGIISVGVLDQQGLSKGTGHIEFSKCISGENKIVAKTRAGQTLCSITIFIERNGFVADAPFDLVTLKDQCEVLSRRYEPNTPIVTTAFGFDVPAAFFARYFRQATPQETDLRDKLLDLMRARYGRLETYTPHMYAEAMSTVFHFCLPPDQNIAPNDMVEAIYSILYVPSCHMRGTDCDVTMVHLEKKDGSPHVAVALYDNTTDKNYLVDTYWTSPSMLEEETSAPGGIERFASPEERYNRVTFQYGQNGMRRVDCSIDKWLNGDIKTPFRQFQEMDTMVLDSVYKLYSEISPIGCVIDNIETFGGTSGKCVARFAKRGMGKVLSGCRTVVCKSNMHGCEHNWTEYIVFE